MDLVVKTWNSNALNTGNYRTVIARNSPLFANATPNEIVRAGNWAIRGMKQFKGNVLLLEVTIVAGTIADGIDQLGQWFDEESLNVYQLVIQDSNDSNKEWYVDAESLGITRRDGNQVTIAVHVPEPIWKSSTLNSNSWSVTASGQTRNISVAGNKIARPKFTITPTVARTGSYSYYRYVALANRTTRIYKSAINLPDSDWNTSTLVSGGKMQADGDDCRVFNDETGAEEYRWFGGGGINTTTTRVWVNVNLPPKIELTLSGAIANTGAVSTITVKNTAANKEALKLLAQVPYKFVAIDMGSGTFEIFKFTSTNVNALQITGCTRGQKSTTTFQSHSDGATIRHIHGYYIFYGNSAATAPTVDDGYKPVINLTNSTNTSFDYDDFYDSLYPARSCQWRPEVIKNVGLESEVYTATQYTFADTASVIGQVVKAFQVGTVWRAPTADILWSLYHPAGITTLTWSGYKYRYSSSWCASAVMQKSNDGKTWVNVAAEAKPTNLQTWDALASHSSVSLSGTYLNIRHRLAGTVAASGNNYCGFEITDLTATLNSSNVPLVNFGAETSNNFMEPRITNGATGQWMEFSAPVPLNTTIIIDTDALTITLADGTSVLPRLDDESRQDWLPFSPNATNTLTYTESGATGVTVLTEWRDRNSA